MGDKKDIQGFELLRVKHSGVMQLKDRRTVNYGVIRVTDNEVVYYTGKGLREMFKPNMKEEEKRHAEELKRICKEKNGEQKLINSEHIAVTKLDDIEIVMS